MSLSLQRSVAFNWGVTEVHGWGLVGLHTALYLLDEGHVPFSLSEPRLDTLRPANRARLEPFLGVSARLRAAIAAQHSACVRLEGVDALLALGNDFLPALANQATLGERNIGVLPGEGTRLGPDCIQRANEYERIVCHSNYMAGLLRDHGVRDVALALQGVDPDDVGPCPGPRPGRFEGRFVIFSGGKLEFRKGQDIVCQAFKAFHQRHPEALLVTLWNNLWPEIALTMAESRLAPAAPRIIPDVGVDLDGWCLDNGLAEGSFLNMRLLPREALPTLLWDCDLAVFPNRCEAGTNLVAMEAMACGVPCALSANTGHLDLIADDRCYPLKDQAVVPNIDGGRLLWGETAPEALLDAMEAAYQDREGARAKGQAASRFILGERTWRHFARTFLKVALA
jgi:glycosyltransferase involved in cell wall biosynthesis